MNRIVAVLLGVMGAGLVGCSSSNGGKAAGPATEPVVSSEVERTDLKDKDNEGQGG